MANFGIIGSMLGTFLQSVLMVDGMEPGNDVGYTLATTTFHHYPLGLEIAKVPIGITQLQARDIATTGGLKFRVRDALREWDAIGANRIIAVIACNGRVHGIETGVWEPMVKLPKSFDMLPRQPYRRLRHMIGTCP